MDVELKMDKRKLNHIKKEMLVALEMTSDQLLTDLIESQKMPFHSGIMQNTDTFLDNSELKSKRTMYIVTSAPQARRLYYHPEYNFDQSHNSEAGGLWWDDYLSGSKKELPEQLYRAILKRRLANDN